MSERDEFLKGLSEQAKLLNESLGKGNILGEFFKLGLDKNAGLGNILFGNTEGQTDLFDIDSLTDSLTKLFGDFIPKGEFSFGTGRDIFGAVNLIESEKTYVVTVALPGVSKEEISVSAVDENLIIEVKLNTEKDENTTDFTRFEYIACDLSRTIRLSNMDANGVKVKFNNGELIVNVPKIDLQAVHFEVK